MAKIRKVADDENFRMAGNRAVRLNDDPPRFIELRSAGFAEDAAERRSENAGGPENRTRWNGFGALAVANGHAVRVHIDHKSAHADYDPELLEHAAGRPWQSRRIGREH